MSEELGGATPVRRRSRKLLVGLLAAGLALTGVTVAGLSAANAITKSVTFINASGNSDTQTATVLSGTASTKLSVVGGYYVCESGTLNLRGLDVGTSTTKVTTSIILADGCNMKVSTTVADDQGIYVADGSTLNIFSQTGNTGKLYVQGGTAAAGIGTYTTASTVNIYGGWIRAIGGDGSAGIGGWYNHPAGTIKITGNASVYASGGPSGTQGAAGAGIGGGGSTFGTDVKYGYKSITVSTTGIVQAYGGGGKGPAANIGTGGGTKSNGDPVETSSAVDTVSTTKTVTGSGSTVSYISGYGDSITTGGAANVAVGSQITWTATPAANYSLTSAKGNGDAMGGSGNTRTFPITNSSPATQAAAFIFGQNTTLTQTVSPASPQTRPGNVTVTGTLKVTSTSVGVNAMSLNLYINNVKQTDTAQTNASGVATFTITSPPVGTYSYQLRWAGNDNFAASNATTQTGYVVQRATQSALALNGLGVSYVYGDGPLALTTTGGSGDGAVSLVSSNPTVASLSDQTTAGAATLTVNRAGTFTVTQTKAQDDTYSELVRTTPLVTVNEAIPQAVLTRTGGTTVTEPVDVTLQVAKRGTGTTPQGLVQFYFKSTKLGDPLPLVDGGDGTASVSLTGIPLQAMGMQSVTATFLGETGKYTTVSKSDEWYLGGMGFCKVDKP